MLSEESLQKLIDIYKSYIFDPSLIKHKEDITEVINILLEIPFFADIKRTKGYIILKNIVNNMKIKHFSKNSIVYLNNEKEHNCYILLKGETNEVVNIEKNRTVLGKCYKCESNCFFGVFDSLFYLNNILTNSDVMINDFIEKIKKFKFFSNIFTNHYNKLFLNYDEEVFYKNEIVYRENDKINGIYLILEGEFQLYRKGREKSLKNKIKNNNEEINKLRAQSQLFHKIIFGEGQKVLFNKNKIINNILDSNKDNIKTRFYSNKLPYRLLTLKKGDMFGDLEIIQKNKERKLSVKASGLNNIIWFFPKNIIEEILIQINSASFRNLSESKFRIIKKQFSKMEIIENIRKKFNINNKTELFKKEIEREDSKTNNINSILNIKKIAINKNILSKSKINDNNFFFITQKLRSIETISPMRNKKIIDSSINIKKRILKYLDSRKNKNIGFNYHNFSDDNSLVDKETAYSLLTEKRIVRKKEFIKKNFRSFSTLHKNQEKIKFYNNKKDNLFSKI